MEQEYNEIDLIDLIHIVLAKWWLILIFTLLSMGITGYVTYNYITPMYEAKATLFIGKESNSIAGISIADLQIDNQLVTDYRELIKTRLVTKEVIDKLNIEVSVNEFVSRLQVTTLKDSRFIHIAFQDSNPELAASITNLLSQTLIDKAEDIVGVENVRIVDKAIIPELPISPRLLLNIAIAGVLGVMISLMAIFLLNMLDNTIKNEEDVEKHLQLSVLGVIPTFKGEECEKK